ncbi:AraC family transcriptional regulator [Flavobacterium sp. MEB061]|uniref:AraC family transcriptional regulator n=1 Tax=Flavobacterium sp. MEB061 TaxID=1587524 RepID=UPI0009E231DF|nr:AraC family transcriptional regulator [Flavobacterium sp. MEB061]
MKPIVIKTRNFKESLSFLKIPLCEEMDCNDFSIFKMEELGLNLPCQMPVFRPDHFTIVLITQGSAQYHTGDNTYTICSNHILFIRPNAFLFSKWNSVTKAYKITFHKQFLHQYWPASVDYIQKLEDLETFSASLTDDLTEIFNSICTQIYDESLSAVPYKYEMITNLIFNLLLLIQQYNLGSESDLTWKKYSPQASAFLDAVDDNLSKIFSGEMTGFFDVGHYAQSHNINLNQLSKIIYNSTGKTISQWINKKLIDEIKYVLKYTDKSISEIAYLYGFNDINYFYTYFKKNTKTAPGIFRKNFKNPPINVLA